LDTNRPILFNHIPKTGGTTLRIIFNRVYGADHVFFINSRDIAQSLGTFKSFSEEERNKYKVISGHGAPLFAPFLEHPFRIGVVREPISLFLSQYRYLRQSPNSNFLDEVRSLDSADNYLDYAIKMGQDNLLTRYFSESLHFLLDEAVPIPNLQNEGKPLLEKASIKLHRYDALLDLSNFDQGVFALSKLLHWPKIPIYRPSNVGKKRIPTDGLSPDFKDRLMYILQWDLALYDYFLDQQLAISPKISQKSLDYHAFMLRQKMIGHVARMMGKK